MKTSIIEWMHASPADRAGCIVEDPSFSDYIVQELERLQAVAQRAREYCDNAPVQPTEMLTKRLDALEAALAAAAQP